MHENIILTEPMTFTNLSNDVTSNTVVIALTLHSMAYKFSLRCFDH